MNMMGPAVHDAHSRRGAFVKLVNRLWSPHEDDVLTEMISEDKKFREIAERLPGRSRDACIGRMHRIIKKIEASRC